MILPAVFLLAALASAQDEPQEAQITPGSTVALIQSPYYPQANLVPFAGVYSYAPAYYAAVPIATASQFNAADQLGNFDYGYANLNSAKHELGNSNIGVSGGYQYVDANNQLQTVNYIADGLGFRVADSRLPKPVEANLEAPVFDGQPPAPVEDTVEVAEARAQFLKTFKEVQSRARRESDPQIDYGYPAMPYYKSAFFSPSYRPLLVYRYLNYHF